MIGGEMEKRSDWRSGKVVRKRVIIEQSRSGAA